MTQTQLGSSFHRKLLVLTRYIISLEINDWAKRIVSIVPKRFIRWAVQVVPELNLTVCVTNRALPVIIYNYHVKAGSEWNKTMVCIVPTMFHSKTFQVILGL